VERDKPTKSESVGQTFGSHFEMVAILKILKTKSTTLSDNLFLCQVSKGSAVWSEFNIFCTLVTMATATILNLFNPPKSCHTLQWIFLQSFMKFDERYPKLFKIDSVGLSRSTRRSLDQTL
jgi:hypothetical protein